MRRNALLNNISFACSVTNMVIAGMIMATQSSIFKLNKQNTKFQRFSLWIVFF